MRQLQVIFFLAALFPGSSLWAQTHPGEVVRTISCPSPCPTGIAAEGDRLWVVDRFTDKIYELDAASGKVRRELDAPCYQPTGLTVDDEGKLWVGSDMPDFGHDQLYRLDPDSEEVIAVVPSPVGFVRSLAWQGKALWVGTRKQQLVRVDPDDGSVLSNSPVPSAQMTGLGFDGKYLWSGDRAANRLYVIEPRTGEVVFVLGAPGPSVSGVACAGGRVYVLDYEKRAVFEVRAKGEASAWTYDPRKLTLCYRVIFHNRGPAAAPLLTTYIAVPENTVRQKLLSEIRWEPKPAGFEKDEWDVPFARFEFADVPPGATVEARMHLDVEMCDLRRAIYPEQVQGLDAIPPEIKARYLNDANKYQLQDPYLRKLVKETVGDEKNPWWIARKLAHAVGERMTFEMTGGWEPAPVVLQRGSGSCSEYSFAFLALCRIAGVPARYVGSIVVRTEDGSCDESFHRWAQVYLPPFGWVDWDVQAADAELKGTFAEQLCFRGNHRLVTTYGGGPSKILVWEYNSQYQIKAKGQADILVEKYGEWSPYSPPARAGAPSR
jgi:transglutaminase-like putative cysteine protease/DNA-binding beta-propeller fold protein YncE